MNYKLWMIALSFSAAAAMAQDTVAPPPPDAVWVGGSPGNYTFSAAIAGPGMRFEGAPVKDAPYSAEAVSESTQTLADGNKIHRENRSAIYRDSQGRTRREETLNALGPWATQEPNKTIFINDPVAGVHYVLNPADHTGQKLPMPQMADHLNLPAPPPGGQPIYIERRVIAGPAGMGATAGAMTATAVKMPSSTSQEDLGTRIIEGVEAKGTLFKTVLPAEQLGADRDVEITFEQWHSPELGVDVLTTRNDPRIGKTTYKLVNINRTEPLPSLFEPPADYEIRENQDVFFKQFNGTPPNE